MEIIRIPFEGKEIVGYLKLPTTSRPAPLVIGIGGLDVYKEALSEMLGAGYLSAGLGISHSTCLARTKLQSWRKPEPSACFRAQLTIC